MINISEQLRDFKSFEITFHANDNTLHKLLCDLQTIDTNTLLIHVDNKKNNNILAPLGAELQVNIYTDYGVFSSSSKILSVKQGTICTEYEIEYPSHCKHSQRREYFRADLCTHFLLDITMNENDEKFYINGVTKNICGKGICYVADKPFSSYSHIDINLFFPNKTITTRAELVYSKPQIIGEKTKFINAFIFPEISTKDIDFIVKQCFLYQLKLRKKDLE